MPEFLLVASLVLAGATERFEDVAFRLSSRPVDVACAEMEQWVTVHHGRDDAARGLLWIARRRLEVKDWAAARDALTRATDGRGRFGAEATRLLAAMDLEDGRLDDARNGAEVLLSSTDPLLAGEGRLLLDEVHAKEQRRIALAVAIAFLAVDVAVRAVRTRKKLWPPPFEALAAGPLLLLLVVIGGVRGMSAELPVVAAFAAVGTVLVWARGAHRRAFPLAAGGRALDAVLALVEAGAISYAVLDAGGALDMLVLTFTAGPA